MKLISTKAQLLTNIKTLGSYLSEPSGPNADFARSLIQRGICFVVTSAANGPFFASSRFVGYSNNSRSVHLTNDQKDGRDTTPTITGILNQKATHSEVLERKYRAFCARNGIHARESGEFRVQRKFWDLS
jgi:hypothetical protein